MTPATTGAAPLRSLAAGGASVVEFAPSVPGGGLTEAGGGCVTPLGVVDSDGAMAAGATGELGVVVVGAGEEVQPAAACGGRCRQLASLPLMKKKVPDRSNVSTVLPSSNLPPANDADVLHVSYAP
ncbi:hypothetical protein E2562_015456 [Oryza meyeriana var. granulata]|uniref:Uncharacterized protein n=1 Tax=Oryza meyeriana var. granulata TaxID=110450 RepID=A0A6G1BWZ9_9ORYZ|nr:hypothetical protein E2562_015456 [Oryza meyeriana var. granulata]